MAAQTQGSRTILPALRRCRGINDQRMGADGSSRDAFFDVGEVSIDRVIAMEWFRISKHVPRQEHCHQFGDAPSDSACGSRASYGGSAGHDSRKHGADKDQRNGNATGRQEARIGAVHLPARPGHGERTSCKVTASNRNRQLPNVDVPARTLPKVDVQNTSNRKAMDIRM
jgi:hypothetical protein